jgi:hypothetical protein
MFTLFSFFFLPATHRILERGYLKMGNQDNLLPALFIIACGIFALAGAYFQWSWFMGDRKARFVQKIFGHTGTRIFYTVIGLLLITLGTMALFGYDTLPIKREPVEARPGPDQ